jgi:hypothetical protein
MMEIFDILNSVPFLSEGVTLVMAAHSLALAIVNMTETPKDNEAVAKAYKYIEFLAGIVTKKAKS